MKTLPKRFAQYAAHLAAFNKVAYKSEKDALRSLRDCYHNLVSSEETTGASTGGFYFHKDGDGDIDLYIRPSLVWGDRS